MPVWPKLFYTTQLTLRTAATQRKLRTKGSAQGSQDAAFRSLTGQLAATSFWKPLGIEAGMSYLAFQTRVPVHGYAQLAPAIARMQRGEANVLWPGRCTLFGLTAGTTGGTPKCIPMTDDLLAHFRSAGSEALLYYTGRVHHTGVLRGRHLFYTSSTALLPVDEGATPASFMAESSGITALSLPKWAEEHWYEPGAAAAQQSSWDTQLTAITSRARNRDITLIAGAPQWVTLLAQHLRSQYLEHDADASLLRHWPNLECLIHSGAPIAPYARELRQLLGHTVTFHEVYAASEAFVAAQDGDASLGLRLMTDKGVFFEFVPLSDFDDLKLELLGAKAVPASGVKTGVDYAVLITTPGGLVRYALGDVVRFTSTEPLRLVHVGGTELRLNAYGENVTERELTDSLVGLCQSRNWTLVNFHVAPLFSGNEMTGQRRGTHEWWVELKPGTVITPTGPQMAGELDAMLVRTNAAYAAKRAAGMIEPPVVRLVMPGVFEHWLRFHQKWGGQHKMPRCRSDRMIAEQFAHVTNFAPD